MNDKLLIDVLRALITSDAGRITLDGLCDTLGVGVAHEREGVRPRALRREDVRQLVTRLDEAGLVDASRMRLTLQGLALATALGPALDRATLHLVA